ncbi:hypothetical protein G7007_18710 [Pseudomonas entomophila]|nr:hypothetical protein [Pseudomonas entomophila]MBA1194860.1 hypothetical protein [Pseudomonas entomophila]
MNRNDDTSGLQILLSGAIALGLMFYAIGIFVYRLYVHRDRQIEQESNE